MSTTSSFENVDNALNQKSQLEASSTYRAINDFLMQYKTDCKKLFNIIDQNTYAKYNIPEKLLPKFFTMAEQCRKRKLITGFTERQDGYSGIVLDFDVRQKDDKEHVNNKHYSSVIQRTIKLLKTIIDLPDGNIHVLVTKRPEREYVDEYKWFKDGFHIVFPGIKIEKMTKKYLIKRMIDTNMLNKVFKDIDKSLSEEPNRMIDTNSSSFVTLLPGSSKRRKKPYTIHKVYVAEIDDDMYNISEMSKDGINIVHEFSINSEKEDGIIKKIQYDVKDSIKSSLERWVRPNDLVRAKNHDDLSILNMHDPDAAELKKILDLLSKKRCGDYNDWFKVVCALAYIKKEFKPLAYNFSTSRDSGIVREEFDRVWEGALSEPNKYHYSKASIYSMAKEDNPKGFNEVINEGLFAKVNDIVFDNMVNGKLGHYHIMTMIKKMVGDKFIVDKHDGETVTAMYEFVLDGDDIGSPGEIYKWRKSDDCESILRYMSETVTKVFKRVTEHLAKRKLDADDDKTKSKFYAKIIKNVNDSGNKLYDNGFKHSVLRECRTHFRRRGFCNKLDQEPNVIGVRNGVLTFDPTGPQLIQTKHDYFVSRYTNVPFREFKEDNQLLIDVFTSIWILFPEGEKTAFRWHMMFASTSLTNRLKALILLFAIGGGANGKTYFMEMIRNLLGEVFSNGYGYKMNIAYFTEKMRNSNDASAPLMPLKHSRFTTCSESENCQVMQTSSVKRLLSHEPINARNNYENTQNFKHKSNFMVASQHKFRILTTDHGTWRRIKQYNWKIKFVEAPHKPDPLNPFELEADPTFTKDKVCDPMRLSAFLYLLSMYLTILDNQYDGNINKVPSPVIDRETDEYRNSQDVMNRFINARVVITVDRKQETNLSDIIDSYQQWYKASVTEENHFDRTTIQDMLEASKIKKYKTVNANNAHVFVGIRVIGPGEMLKIGEERVGKIIHVARDEEKKRLDDYKFLEGKMKNLSPEQANNVKMNFHRDSAKKELSNLFKEFNKQKTKHLTSYKKERKE